MNMELLKIDAASILLFRSVQGALSQSTSIFALKQINSCLRSNTLRLYALLVAEQTVQAVAQSSGWSRAESAARHFSATIIQRCFRGYYCRLLAKLSRESGDSFWSRMNLSGSERPSSTPSSPSMMDCDSDVISSSLPAAIKALQHNMRMRVQLFVANHLREQNAARSIQRFARLVLKCREEDRIAREKSVLTALMGRVAMEAERDVSELLTGSSGSVFTQCELRLAVKAREAQLMASG